MVASVRRPYQLLIADDDAEFRATVRSIFEPQPWLDTFEADSGEEAIAVARQNRVDLVLLDMHMQVLTGLETLKILKSINVVVPCILITADATAELERDAIQADAWTVLRKPLKKSRLVETVSLAISETYDDTAVIIDLGSKGEFVLE